jgi:hypothetical protein
MSKLRKRFTFANVMSVIAVFIALGGTGYAALKLPKNSVGAKQLKKNSVTPPKIAPATVARFRGATGPVGPAGPSGPSDAYIDREDAIQPLTGAATPNQVAKLALPAGSYVVSAKLLADNDAAVASRIDCSLDAPVGNEIDFMKLRLAPTNEPNLEFGNISLAGAVALNSPDSVSVQCQQLGPASPGITVGFRKLIAVKVGALHP